MNCANCGTELVPDTMTHPMRRRDYWTVQYRDSLAVTIHGGYGMFFDVMHSDERERTASLCHDCAHAFVRANPWLMNLLAAEIVGPVPPDRTIDELGHMHEGTDFGRLGHGHE